jgi:hypothetical protein
MAQENALWGCRRIVGELKKLDLCLGSSSVKRILKGAWTFPASEKAKKQPPILWSTFIHATWTRWSPVISSASRSGHFAVELAPIC